MKAILVAAISLCALSLWVCAVTALDTDRVDSDREVTGLVAANPVPRAAADRVAEAPTAAASRMRRESIDSPVHVVFQRRDPLPRALKDAIDQAEYRIRPSRDAVVGAEYTASNRAQAMRASFTPAGIEVTPEQTAHRLRLELRSVGRRGDKTSVALARLAVADDRIEYYRSTAAGVGFTEWFVNAADGIEQGFTFAQRPVAASRAPLVVTMAIAGDYAPLLHGEDAVLFTARSGGCGGPRLRYAGLCAFDATGRDLPAHMNLDGGELSLIVDDEDALYPITVDPLVTTETTTLTPSDPTKTWDRFNVAIAMSGDTALIGSDLHAAAGNNAGAAYVFVRQGGTWVEQAKLLASDAAPFDQFGGAVALSGDTALIGARLDDDAGSNSGSAYVFVRTGTTWTEQAKLTASDAYEGQDFGIRVGLSGDTALIGADMDDDGATNAGSAYVFTRSGTVWTERKKLLPSDPGPGHRFGYSLTLCGDTALVGAWWDHHAGPFAGSAYVFVGSGASWTEQAKLTASDAANGDQFSISVALDGDTAVVGSWGDDDFGSNSGSAYVYVRSGTSWTEQAKLNASDVIEHEFFGDSVAVEGDTAIIGAFRHAHAGPVSGAAYRFVRQGSTWTEQDKLLANGGTGWSFGLPVVLHNDTVMIGTNGANNTVYVFDLVREVRARSGNAPVYNLESTKTVKVVVFSEPDFDATTINPASVAVGDPALTPRVGGVSQVKLKDVDGDGRTDVEVEVGRAVDYRNAGAWNAATTETEVTADSAAGRIRGVFPVTIVGK